jgi:hypothetical protein
MPRGRDGQWQGDAGVVRRLRWRDGQMVVSLQWYRSSDEAAVVRI